ncbi:MAG: AzlC family ABC transporter permease [Streptococcaceae bacterium]|jgi:4-azaleucine resistance transporter AzlC|nr:AzlC family ABC transporter permease [Streptococcaceae bacterium]
MNADLSFRAGIHDTLPTVFGYIGIGIAFGIVAHASNLVLWAIFMLSSVVFAGSAQFIMVAMLASKSPALSIILAVFLVNSRMILMAMTSAGYFKEESIWRNIWIGTLLTDESFALGMNKRNLTGGQLSFSWFSASNTLAYLVWNVSTLIGALAGSLITNPYQLGLGFAMTAMFIGLLFGQMAADKSMTLKLQGTMVVLTLALYILGLIVIPANFLVLAVTLMACAIGLGVKHGFH